MMQSKGKDLIGVPPNPLPIWRHLPYNYKIPMPTVVPKGAVQMFTGRIGEEIWRRDECLDFDLWDPNLYQLPAPQEYNALKDPHLRAFMENDRLQKRLTRHGLITKEGGVLCRLLDFNRYRRYLHNFDINVVKQHEHDTEPEQIKEMMFSSLGRVQKQRNDAFNSDSINSNLGVRYSSVLVTESANLRQTTDPDFDGSALLSNISEGERQSLKSCRNMLQEEFRKTALIRLRRLQDYDDRQLKGLNDWRKRRIAQLEWLAEEKFKQQQLEGERLRHIREHIEFSGRQKRHMERLIRRYAEKRFRDIREQTIRMSRWICVKSQRQWPLSARCPANSLGQDPDNPFSLSACCTGVPDFGLPIPFDSPVQEKPVAGQPTSEGVRASASMTTTLTEHIVQNAINLIYKYSKSPALARKQLSSAMSSPDKGRFGKRKVKKFVTNVAKDVKQEMRNLVHDSPEVLIAVANNLRPPADGQPLNESGLVDWDRAPVMKSSSTSFTGQYVRDTLIEVAGQMTEEGLITGPLRTADVDDKLADAIMDLSLKTTTDDLRSNLLNGSEMVELAGKILQSHRYGESGNAESTEELSVCLITSLIRTALLKFKEAMLKGSIKDSDLITMASSVDMNSFVQAVVQHVRLQAKVDEFGKELLTNEGIEKIIAETVEKINNADSQKFDEEVKSHISEAAKRFIAKIIDSVFEDIDPRPRQKSAKPSKTAKRKKICLRPGGNASNNSNVENQTEQSNVNNSNVVSQTEETNVNNNADVSITTDGKTDGNHVGTNKKKTQLHILSGLGDPSSDLTGKESTAKRLCDTKSDNLDLSHHRSAFVSGHLILPINKLRSRKINTTSLIRRNHDSNATGEDSTKIGKNAQPDKTTECEKADHCTSEENSQTQTLKP